MLKAKNITVILQGKEVLSKVSFSLEEEKCALFLGKSGSGKTTLLRSALGLLPISEGEIEETKEGMKKGFVSQNLDLFPRMSVLQNCIHPQMKVLKRSKEKSLEKAMDLLSFLDMKHVKDEFPENLSGGQKQRAAIIRALCMDIKFLFFDEPTSALDMYSKASFRLLIQDLKKRGLTLVMSTHDVTFVDSLVDRVYLLEKGKIIDSHDFSISKEIPNDSLLKKYIDGSFTKADEV